jgi:chromosome segregation ATPase
MKDKLDYVNTNEIRVKGLLSEMFNNESRLLTKIKKKKDHLKEVQAEIDEMEKDYTNQNSLRNDLTEKFNSLKESAASGWESFKEEYEMVLDLAEGDKSRFIQKAESFIDDLNNRIGDLEDKIKSSTESAKEKSQKTLDELNERKTALQKRLEEAREDTGELWIEVKQWFIERAKSIRSLF